ncbi:double-strand break repair helicase AddA [Paracoccus sp. (in: a-proteobacteria)]|uniref:double-strand break repair helicase AddA n=2 Tax=unclassified Paracoccus (in: a-proteobacteria) TaxID=2688777 RepID=UPI0023735E1B|nr:double-strand break repair helicase AddA [Paracoccus sp. UBA5162]MDB2551536.1 double-strand break repair helicase AddA [Paracoccus sp. (in: a-proteobacteria)]|tara:strand:- start:1409 stop:4780 length:3372 start_codon:yes stop_codon:yes gene_type:complete
MDDATRNQIEAADPACSTWLTANAGSGKTRVLTDRVARLLLGGTRPERILCLTYTKAAATEMQNRLLARLGRWAMLPETDLRRELADLGETGTPDLAQARRLFASAIEAPGGLKVQTIHSFCAALLRRFPLEAGVAMGFSELDDRSARALRARIVEEMAEAGDPAIRDLTALHGGDDLDRFLAGLSQADFSAPPDAEAIWAAMDVPAGLDDDRLLAQVFEGAEADLFDALTPILRTGKPTDQKLAETLGDGRWRDPGLAELRRLCGCLLFGGTAADPFGAKIGKLPTKELRLGPCAPFMDDLEALMRRVQDARPQMTALQAAQKTLALHRFAHAFTTRLAGRKTAHGWLDFDDLIRRAALLLEQSSMAQWVLWRLDGGIDHILVDEAQDTSPEQWRVIRRLTDEFTSGAGAHDRPRTLFVVGDPKQSIYSFQGADIAVFEEMRDRFDRDFRAVRQPMQQRGLRHSFRSSPAILSVVDAVFQGEAAQGLGVPPEHIAFRADLPGRVDIWPPLPEPETPEEGDWTRPVDAPAENAADRVLARAIAGRIRAMLGGPIMDVRNGQPRPVGPGDIQILVQRRAGLFDDLIRELKAANLPVAGADRLKLAAELAVRDITATLAVLATPEDSLSLAAALRSPLFGLSEDDLYRLAAGRGRAHLWQRLRASDHRTAREVLADLMAQADRLRPYDLISRLLIRHGGRMALLARLGPEAEDGIDELLSQAMAYEQAETPSLTGFLVWLASDEVQVKRQLPGGSGGLIRVMTVHGAKGLESPIVILPETRKRRADGRGRIVRLDGMPAWKGAAPDRPDALTIAVAEQERRQDEERRRLLYVAMTRAESWLIVAAAGETGAGLDSWHGMITDGAARAALPRSPIEIEGVGQGTRLTFGAWPEWADAAEAQSAAATPRPAWLACVPEPVARPPRPVAATGLGGAKVLAAATDDSDPAAAMLRGTRLHLLLEHLPGTAAGDWPGLARAVLAGAEGGLPDEARLADLLAEARAVIEAPDLADIIDPGPDAQVLREVALSAPLPGIGILHGTIDRLIVTANRILAVDYKSNATVPATPEAAPDGILRQMAAYRAALRQIWPGRRIEVAILWTATRSLMEIPDPLLDRALAALDPADPRS